MSNPTGYLKASQHPWPCFLFVLPLLVLYEAAVLRLGGNRNGADSWLRSGLQRLGLKWVWALPVLLILGFLFWVHRRRGDRPGDLLGVLSGMGIESVAFALGLWTLSRVLVPLMQAMGVALALGQETDPALQLIPYLGAGIYEEMVFRVFLFSVLFALLCWIEAHRSLALLLAALGSATLFSLAHHLGPYGLKYRNYDFVFRVLAGLYFALIYHSRGVGIAVGTHACYNIMISVGSAPETCF